MHRITPFLNQWPISHLLLHPLQLQYLVGQKVRKACLHFVLFSLFSSLCITFTYFIHYMLNSFPFDYLYISKCQFFPLKLLLLAFLQGLPRCPPCHHSTHCHLHLLMKVHRYVLTCFSSCTLKFVYIVPIMFLIVLNVMHMLIES